MVKYEFCGKEVPEHNIDRWEKRFWCRADDRATDLCVGDLNK